MSPWHTKCIGSIAFLRTVYNESDHGLQEDGSEQDDFLSPPRKILMELIENTFPLHANVTDPYDLQALEFKVHVSRLALVVF